MANIERRMTETIEIYLCIRCTFKLGDEILRLAKEDNFRESFTDLEFKNKEVRGIFQVFYTSFSWRGFAFLYKYNIINLDKTESSV